jgi:recombination protein RecA
MNIALLRAEVEKRLPSAFTTYTRENRGSIPTGISTIDTLVQGIPLHAMTEICGSNIASSGKTSVLVSLLAQVSQDRCCALIDASDAFDPETGYAAGINFSRLLWVRCGKTKAKLRPLEQAFKVADILLQNGGFKLIAVDVSGIGEHIVRRIPLSTWFRFSRVVEKQSTALVFIEQEPHATSCAELVLRLRAEPGVLSENLFSGFDLKVEVLRSGAKKPVRSEGSEFSLHTQWA